MIYLIGLYHDVQHKGFRSTDPDDKRQRHDLINKFKIYLKENYEKLKFKLIAEELSKEVLLKGKTDYCTAREVAKELGIDHRFCDPESDDRKILGIPSTKEIREKLGLKVKGGLNHQDIERLDKERRKYYPIREQFWFDKIEGEINDSIIFICGSEHVDTFEKLLIKKSCDVKVLNERW